MQQSHQAGASSGAYRLNPAMCRSFMSSGECSWGDRCKFTHGPSTPSTGMQACNDSSPCPALAAMVPVEQTGRAALPGWGP